MFAKTKPQNSWSFSSTWSFWLTWDPWDYSQSYCLSSFVALFWSSATSRIGQPQQRIRRTFRRTSPESQFMSSNNWGPWITDTSQWSRSQTRSHLQQRVSHQLPTQSTTSLFFLLLCPRPSINSMAPRILMCLTPAASAWKTLMLRTIHRPKTMNWIRLWCFHASLTSSMRLALVLGCRSRISAQCAG